MTRSSQTEYERVAGVLEACADAEKRLGGHPYRAKIMRRSAELLRRADALLRTPRGEGEADAYLVERRGDGSWVRVDTSPRARRKERAMPSETRELVRRAREWAQGIRGLPYVADRARLLEQLADIAERAAHQERDAAHDEIEDAARTPAQGGGNHE